MKKILFFLLFVSSIASAQMLATTGIVASTVNWATPQSTTLLPLNGANTSTVCIDYGITPKTWTAHGNAQISTTQSEFSGASAYFDGTGDYFDTPANADFNFGSGDFTIDFWMRADDVTRGSEIAGGEGAIYDRTTASFRIGLTGTSRVYWQVYSGTNITPSVESGVLSSATWYHIACIVYNNKIFFYINGVATGSGITITGTSVNNSIGTLSVGTFGAYLPLTNFAGYIDEFRITKGLARWTSNFVPPVLAYPY